MKNKPLNKPVLIAFSLLCLACVGAITFVLYDVVANASGSDISGYGAAALFIMIIALAARKLWESRERN